MSLGMNSKYSVSKKQDTLFLPITLPNVDWFSKFFHRRTQQCSCSEVIPPHLRCSATLPCETQTSRNQRYSKRTVLFNNKFELNLNVLANLYHTKYWKCPPVARRQARRRLRRWSTTSLITPCSTAVHTSIDSCGLQGCKNRPATFPGRMS